MREIEVLTELKENFTTKPIRIIHTQLRYLSNRCMLKEFGTDSKIFGWCKISLRELYHRAASNNLSHLNQIFQKWENIFSCIYGNGLSAETFLNHVYLTLLIKSVLFLKINNRKFSTQQIRELLSGESFKYNNGETFFDWDLTVWLADEFLFNDSSKITYDILEILSSFDLSEIDEDIFRELYEQLIEQKDRHKAGEYYTPRWLAELILDNLFLLWKSDLPPKIIDPACGSGTFLFHAVKYLIERYQPSSTAVLKYIAGIDTNPMAVIVTKTNLILSSGAKNIQPLSVYFRDALKNTDLFSSNGNIKNYDIMVGNPPWIVLRSIKIKPYQNFIKKEMVNYKLINNGDTHLHTQLDTATLFFRKCADKYLNNSGIIAFVMPRSVIGSTLQHREFRKFESPQIKLLKVIDLENVSPLFNMPACVLIGKKGFKNSFPVPLEKYEGELHGRDFGFSDTIAFLSVNNDQYMPSENGGNLSYYYNKFKVGLSIFPRSLYFIDLQSIKGECILIKTSSEILRIVKEPWKHELTGNIKEDFIYYTVLPYEMVPFGFTNMRPVILPLLIKNDKYEILDIEKIYDSGASDWFAKTQKIWDTNKTEKAKDRFPKLTDRLNYNNLLSCQHPNNRYIVLYNATGKNITSCVVDRSNLPELTLNSYLFFSKGFVADVKTWYYGTNSKEEAHFLSTILNSTILNTLIKPFQPRGLFGERAIHRRPLQFPIPMFDKENDLHNQLAAIGEQLDLEVKKLVQKKYSKNNMRKIIKTKIIHVDDLVSNLIEVKKVK
ncbi:MAG: SAM-dependent DNA methyltransferase [Candidatus Atribacteria bacterium]|nr:SAM-dependent DNA methyltransferase [Candidatus Atribacteria bacterium]